MAGKNDFVPLFIGWNELQEYKMPYTGFELTKEESYFFRLSKYADRILKLYEDKLPKRPI